MITKDQYQEFSQSNVYQEMKAAVLEQLSELGAEIINREVPNVNRDQFARGVIRGLQEVLEWRPAFVEDNIIINDTSEEEE